MCASVQARGCVHGLAVKHYLCTLHSHVRDSKTEQMHKCLCVCVCACACVRACVRACMRVGVCNHCPFFAVSSLPTLRLLSYCCLKETWWWTTGGAATADTWYCALGSGPRYMICVTYFTLFAHGLRFFDLLNMQKRATKSDTSGHCLLVTAEQGGHEGPFKHIMD